MKALVAWRGGKFLTEGEIGVLSVVVLQRVGVCHGCARVFVCICMRMHCMYRCMCIFEVLHALWNRCPGYQCMCRCVQLIEVAFITSLAIV